MKSDCFYQQHTNTKEDDWFALAVMHSETFERATGFDDTAHQHNSTTPMFSTSRCVHIRLIVILWCWPLDVGILEHERFTW